MCERRVAAKKTDIIIRVTGTMIYGQAQASSVAFYSSSTLSQSLTKTRNSFLARSPPNNDLKSLQRCFPSPLKTSKK